MKKEDSLTSLRIQYVQETIKKEFNCFANYYADIQENGTLFKIKEDVDRIQRHKRCLFFNNSNTIFDENIETKSFAIKEPNVYLKAISSSVSLKYDEKKGRKFIANKGIEIGHIILKENASIIRMKPNCTCYENEIIYERCYHCTKIIKKFYVCRSCDICLFCSFDCMETALNDYHSWECLAVQTHFWDKKIDYSYMAMRMMMYGVKNNVFMNDDITEKKYNNYNAIWNLETSFDKISSEELNDALYNIMRTITYLVTNTSFFTYLQKLRPNYTNDEIVNEMGGIMLHHYLQAKINLVIMKLENVPFDSLVTCIEHVIHGIFPTAALLNHSCNPNCNLILQDNNVVVVAANDIEENEEITICYSEIDPLLPVKERQSICQNKFNFVCECNRCVEEGVHPDKCFRSLCCDNEHAELCSMNNKTWLECLGCGRKKNCMRYNNILKSLENFDKGNKKKSDLETAIKYTELVCHPNCIYFYKDLMIFVKYCIDEEKDPILILKYGLTALDIMESIFAPAYILLRDCQMEIFHGFFLAARDSFFQKPSDIPLLQKLLQKLRKWHEQGTTYFPMLKLKIILKLETQAKLYIKGQYNEKTDRKSVV